MRDSFFMMVIVPLVLIMLTVVGLIAIPAYISSCKSAEIYNRINKTNYTCSDFFWAGSQINQQTQTIKLEE